MFLLDWMRQYKEIKHEFASTKREEHICESCETLKMQLAIANNEKTALLNRLLEKPEPESKPDISNLRAVLPTRHTSFNARRQILEREDRAQAKIIQQQKQEAIKLTPTEKLEEELDIPEGKEA